MASGTKIGVLTFHRCINYGSYWQARCLVEALCALGCDAVLLDHDSAMVNRREWRCALDPQLPSRSPAGDRALNEAKVRAFYEALSDLPHTAKFPLDDPQSADDCDVIVVGSDEVWNLSHPWYGGHAAFYGSGLKAERLVSYAASFGNQSASKCLPAFWADALSKFTLLSVRDFNSREIVRDALGREAEVVLDPCLLHPPAIEPQMADDARPYIAVYGHSFPSWYSSAIRKWATDARYRLISIGYRNEWADEQLIATGPRRFARLISGAAAVATNFFHGCVFALINHKPFACVSSQYRANKLTDLMLLLSTEKHLVVEEASAGFPQRLLGQPLEPHVPQRIAELRLRSQRFIQDAVAS